MPDAKDAPNFGWVSSWLARGADPNPAGFRWATQTAGIRTIVNLRAEDNTEADLAPALDFRPIQIPVIDNAPPTQEQALQFLALCADEANYPVFVHCQSGHGRTSTFCILVRLAQGWRLDDAIEESVRRHGFQPEKDRGQVAFVTGMQARAAAGEITLPALPV